MTNVLRSESVILCEGYHDRSFWNGLLQFTGCFIPNQQKDASTGQQEKSQDAYIVKDPTGKRVTGGQYGYLTKSSRFLRVVPCRGKDNILPEFRSRLGQRKLEPVLSRIVINVDPDVIVSEMGTVTTGLRTQDLLREVQASFDANAMMQGNEIYLDGGETKVSLVRWEVVDANIPGIPDQQTLERLVCAAICTAYPQRGPNVQNFLNGRHDPQKISVKEFAWSHMAGWYAEHGCDDFYRCLWDDPKVAEELKVRLKASGAWQIAEALTT